MRRTMSMNVAVPILHGHEETRRLRKKNRASAASIKVDYKWTHLPKRRNPPCDYSLHIIGKYIPSNVKLGKLQSNDFH